MAMKPSSKFGRMKLKTDDLPPQFVTPDRAQKTIDENKAKNPPKPAKPPVSRQAYRKDFGGAPSNKLPRETFGNAEMVDARRAALLKGIKRK